MRYQINSKEIFVDLRGEGEPILLVHGLGGSSNYWASVIAEFSPRFKIIAPDLPCSGRSAPNGRLTIDSLADDLLSLLDHLDCPSAHLVGHSMGTIICQHIAAKAPERVLDLVLLGPLSEPIQAARGALNERAALARTQGMTPIALAIYQAGLSEETRTKRPLIAGFVKEMVMAQSPEGYALSCIALAAWKGVDPAKITCKTLLITGTDDVVAPPENVQALCDALPHARIKLLSGCGHWTAVEKPSEVNTQLRKFYA